ncbi:MAG: DUF1800 domain-containing protein [Phycisphaerales bacterium]
MLTQGTEPLKKSDFDYAAARHLVDRAGFGGTPEQIRALADLGLEKAVDALLEFDSVPFRAVSADDFDRDLIRPLTDAERAELQRARREKDEAVVEAFQRRENESKAADRRQLSEMKAWWLQRMIETSRPLEEKMTLFWHGHFASGFRTVEDSWNMFQQNQLFRRYAVGNFATLVLEIIRDPAMIKYLDNDDSKVQRPNENLARELMELFVLGEGNGYSEQDIKEGARALTGYTFRDNTFEFRENDHDPGVKVIFGQRGNWNGDEFARIVLSQKASSEFLMGKLYRFFVNDNPARPAAEAKAQKEFVKKLASQLRREQYELKPVLRTLFRSAHFYAPENRGTVIKSPVQLVVQTVRQYHTPVRSLAALASACDLMGQDLFQPPNVKGWDGGRAWINTSTLFVRQNLAIYLLTGRRPDIYDWEVDTARWDAMPLVEHLRKDGVLPPEVVVDFLLRTALPVEPHQDRRDVLLAFAKRDSAPLSNDRILALLALITALPEFQLC